jgi:prepilin-type processing-associated H-X9-DG protein
VANVPSNSKSATRRPSADCWSGPCAEVKTLRRQLSRLAAHHHAEQLGAELARVRVAQRGELMGFLYVDGHVRAYHGERTISNAAYVARRHLAMPATTDYWINDRAGDPLLVVTADINASLAKAFPNLLRQVRETIGDERQVTIVFDRGGWSPKLFRSMIRQRFDILTYRKGKGPLIHKQRFIRRRAKLDGRWVTYDLNDQPVRFLKGNLRLRQITRLCETGHQTQIITSLNFHASEFASRRVDYPSNEPARATVAQLLLNEP